MTLILVLLHVIQVVTLALSAHLCTDPCTIQSRIHIDDNPANEALVIDVESSDYETHSELPVGDGKPLTYYVKYPDLPKGDYTIRVSLMRHDGSTWLAGQDVQNVEVR